MVEKVVTLRQIAQGAEMYDVAEAIRQIAIILTRMHPGMAETLLPLEPSAVGKPHLRGEEKVRKRAELG